MSDTKELVVVIDIGSGLSKAGFAGEVSPKSVFPSILAGSKFLGMMCPEWYAGEEALTRRGPFIIEDPLERGIFLNVDNMEKLWHHAFFNELKVNYEENSHPVLLTEAGPLGSLKNRELTVTSMFETFNTSSLHLSTAGVLGLHSAGRVTGIALDSGEGVTQIMPVYEGYAIHPATSRENFGGRDVTEHLMKLLNEKGHPFSTRAERDVARKMKENLCYVSMDVDKERPSLQDYYLPDGQVVNIQNEVFQCPEILFEQQIGGVGIVDSIQKCDTQLRKEMYSNVILCGGNTMFPGFAQRVQNEIQDFTVHMDINVVANPNRNYSAWIGGSVLASLSTFKEMCITKEDYAECGAGIVHRKCF